MSKTYKFGNRKIRLKRRKANGMARRMEKIKLLSDYADCAGK